MQYKPWQQHQPESNCPIPQDVQHHKNESHQHRAPAKISVNPAYAVNTAIISIIGFP